MSLLPAHVWALVPVAAFELLTGGESVHIGHAIDGANAVQMIDLMLEEFGKILPRRVSRARRMRCPDSGR